MRNNGNIRTIDLFCGAGGSSFGARKAGAAIVAGFDIWQTAIVAYKTNFPEAKAFHNDLRNLSPKVIRKEIGEIDLILGSPECTNHSVAKGARDRCEASKNTAFEVTRFAEVFRPKWIIIENVVEMSAWNKHTKLINELNELKYYVNEIQLNSADFGVPQARNRLFLLCSLSDKIHPPKPTSNQRMPVSSIIDWSDRYALSPVFKKGRAEKTLKRATNAIEVLGKNEPFIMVYYGTGHGWQSIDKPLRTITTLDRFALVIPTKNGHMMRMLQPEELKLAMGFTDEYNLKLQMTRREKIMLMGNGVCPPVMTEILKNLCN